MEESVFSYYEIAFIGAFNFFLHMLLSRPFLLNIKTWIGAFLAYYS